MKSDVTSFSEKIPDFIESAILYQNMTFLSLSLFSFLLFFLPFLPFFYFRITHPHKYLHIHQYTNRHRSDHRQMTDWLTLSPWLQSCINKKCILSVRNTKKKYNHLFWLLFFIISMMLLFSRNICIIGKTKFTHFFRRSLTFPWSSLTSCVSSSERIAIFAASSDTCFTWKIQHGCIDTESGFIL